MTLSASSPGLRPFLPADASRIAALIRASVETLTEEDYDEEQRAAWAARVAHADLLGERLAASLAIVAVLDGAVAGIGSLKDGDLLDMLYVDPRFARRGVGAALAEALEKLAAGRGVRALRVEASDAARDFFARRGYIAKSRNTVEIDGVWLGNTTMIKSLEAPEPRAS